MIMVGLSGGVDSSVTAYLLKRAGHDVHAVFMRNWRETDPNAPCPADQDLLDAVQVADHLNIPLSVVDFHREYRQEVFQHFLDELTAGRTPNPDIWCNARIKFHHFAQYARAAGATAIATGHYAHIHEQDGHYELHTAAAAHKDQSYFLYRLTQEQLAFSHYPLGRYAHKSDIRHLAREAGLVTHNKRDSTGICFIGERAFNSFIQKFLPKTPGPIRDWYRHTIVGEHEGLAFYTLGQRKGLHIGGQKDGHAGPWFVVHKDMSSNTLYVVAGGEDPALYQQEALIGDCHWIHQPPRPGYRYTAKTRYRQPAAPCQVGNDQQHPETYRVVFDTPQRSITPGQALVLYDGSCCLGGGTINHAS